ncbi:NAD(P)-dependent alcohol dehydrogenase [Rhodobacteraceae bacterium R_SAG10]|nr:NAD(P)-dependent alcohol dehydrogenase [Rhodobacteraceae bacterium R_SAG10]
MKAYEIRASGIDALHFCDRDIRAPGPGEVLVRVRASSINFRDYLNVLDPVGRGISMPRTPNSDAAGEVVEVGEGVSRFKTGDRVIGTFFQRWIGGRISADAMASALGGALDGVLAEFVVLDQSGLVAMPPHLSFEEASTLPCAALTAWHSLVEMGQLKAGDTVLLLGTGGVSVMAHQFAVMSGAKVIITSSSDEKLARAKAMGAWQTINYKAHPDWEKIVLDMTGGLGVDHVVEVGGAGTVARSVAAARVGGTIGMIGVLTEGTLNATAIMRKSIRLQGIYVGSRSMFENMNKAIAAHEMRPVVDRTFALKDARAAFHCMDRASHFGKIVITV